jgi:hypothetical protein
VDPFSPKLRPFEFEKTTAPNAALDVPAEKFTGEGAAFAPEIVTEFPF